MLSSLPFPRTTYTILGLLSIRPMSGYDIKQAIKTMLHPFWSESDGQIYPNLKRCVQEGLATAEEKSLDHATKQQYRINTSGLEQLQIWLNYQLNKKTKRDELLLKLTFATQDNKEYLIHMLSERLEETQTTLNALESIPTNAPHTYGIDNKTFWPIVADYNRNILQCEIDWAQKHLNQLVGTIQ